jgi:hypothetical protein
MLTVKLTRETGGIGDATPVRITKILEADEVEITKLRYGEIYDVSGFYRDNEFSFYLADPEKSRPEGFAANIIFWEEAYIENSSGATTEVVRF